VARERGDTSLDASDMREIDVSGVSARSNPA